MPTTSNLASGVTLLDNIPVHLDVTMVMERIKSRSATQRVEVVVRELLEIVLPVARPKVVYKVAHVTVADGKRLDVDGVEFNHHVPTLNFSREERVFPYVATCGVELESLKFPDSAMKDYCLSVIKDVILMKAAHSYFQDYLKRTYNLTEVSRLGPGEAMGTTAQQPKLFSLLGDVTGAIGVKLSPHYLMSPEKSSSGIYFETAVKIESCQLCPNDCNHRHAPHDPELFKTFRKKG
jgi:hypothetical protein